MGSYIAVPFVVNKMTSNVHENQGIMHKKDVAKRDPKKGILPNKTQSKQVTVISL